MAFLFTLFIFYGIISQILGELTMININFLQKGNKRKQAFVNDKFARDVLNSLFPVMQKFLMMIFMLLITLFFARND